MHHPPTPSPNPKLHLLHRLIKRLRPPTVILRVRREDRVTTVEVRQWLPVIVCVGVLIWYLAAPTAMAVMSLVTLVGILLAAMLWAYALARSVTGQRILHYVAVQVGDELEELITLENTSLLPVLWAEFIDRSNLPGYNANSVRGVDAENSIHWLVQAQCSRRGVFALGPWELHLGDPFGIFLVRQVYTERQEILVYPPLAPLPAHLLPHQATLGEHRPLRQPLRAETTNAMYTRPYQPGDPLRRLHWRTTARRSTPFVKVFEPEATSTIWLVPDFDPQVHLNIGEDSTEETMVILTASLALQLLSKHLAVGLLAQTDTLTVIPPRVGQLHLWQLLRALTPLRAIAAPSLTETLNHAQALIPARSQIIVITPSLDSAWPSKLKQITQRGRGAEVILLDPISFGGIGRTETFVTVLAELGLRAKVVRRGEIRPSAPAYGSSRRWEFLNLSSGRAVARQTPRSADSVPLPLGGSSPFHQKAGEG